MSKNFERTGKPFERVNTIIRTVCLAVQTVCKNFERTIPISHRNNEVSYCLKLLNISCYVCHRSLK